MAERRGKKRGRNKEGIALFPFFPFFFFLSFSLSLPHSTFIHSHPSIHPYLRASIPTDPGPKPHCFSFFHSQQKQLPVKLVRNLLPNGDFAQF